MKILKTLAVLALAMCAALVRADPPTQVGRLNFIYGPVSFAPAEASKDWTAATLNRPITTGDRLWADRGARAEMHVGSTAIRTTELTSVDVLDIDDRNIQLGLADGSVNVRLRNLPSSNRFEVNTPHGAVILNEPGSYRISVDPSGAETMVNVRSGQADVFTGASSFPVNANQQARITGTDFLSYDIAAAPPMDEFDRWAATRDRKEDRIASTRYVPPEMTGYEDLDDHGSWRVAGDYGSVWVPASVPLGWAPYRYGHWVWISPWGWTWVDSAPWGFAPFHYGRWVWLGNHWAWAPGRIVARPVYAPALVAFVGGSNWSVSVGVGSAPVVGWVPLGWREPYIPWYRASHAHVQNVNVTHVTNVTNITNVTKITHVNRSAPSAVTIVSRENFVAARPVQQAALRVPAQTVAAAPVTQGAPVAAPARTSLAASQPGARPPASVRTREAIAVNTPPAPAHEAERRGRENGRAALAGNDDRPRVRVIDPQQRVNPQAADAQRGNVPAVQAPSAAEVQRPQEQQAGRNRAEEKAQPQAQQKAPPVEANRNERGQEKGAQQAQPAPQPAETKRSERIQEKAAPQPPQQAERRAPAPPPEVSRRPTFDREMRQVAPQAGTPSASEARREQASGQGNNTPQAQSAPQPDIRATPRPAPEVQRAQQQAQEQQAREQQARQREMQQREEERQKAQQQRAQQQAQEQQAREQQVRQREMQQREEERQRAQQQRAQQQAQEQQAREQQARQREIQQQQLERQRVQQQQEQQRQQQAQARQAREQQARQQEMQQQREQRLRENAEKRAPQASPPAVSERPAPPAPRPEARDRERNDNHARAERQEHRPAPTAEPRREKAPERPAAEKKPERD